MKKFLEEFKRFAIRGNVIDMAVGVIIGGAFSAIVNSLVNDILSPLLGIITGGLDFSVLSIAIGGVELRIGLFLNALISFALIAFVVFLMIKCINCLKKPEEASVAEPAKSDEVLLLEQIVELLKEK